MRNLYRLEAADLKTARRYVKATEDLDLRSQVLVFGRVKRTSGEDAVVNGVEGDLGKTGSNKISVMIDGRSVSGIPLDGATFHVIGIDPR